MTLTSDVAKADVLVVTAMFPTLDAPAFGIAVQREVDALRRRGVSVSVVSKRRGLFGYLRQANQLRKVPEPRLLIHAHYGTVGLMARLLFPRIPLVLTLHGSDVSYGGRPAANKYWLQYWLTVAGCAASIRILVQSQEMVHQLPRRLRKKTTVQGQSLAPAFQEPSCVERSSPPVILFLSARGRPEKKFALASTACSLLPLGLVVRSLDEFSPHDIPNAMRQATVGLLTSVREGLPIAVKEALVSGLPVVAVDLPSLRELAPVACDRIMLVAPDPEAIAKALEVALVMDDDQSAVEEIVRKMDEKGWLEPGHSDRLIDIYQANRRRRS